jgi:hypothetical protein
MGRNNTIIKSVFCGIVENKEIEKFQNNDKTLGINLTPDLKEMLELYDVILQPLIPTIKELADMEELIIQLRARECIDDEVKITIQREYIYVRSSFVRNGKETKDMRCIVGKTEMYGTDVDIILKNESFMTMAKTALYDVMTTEINKSINKLKILQEA